MKRWMAVLFVGLLMLWENGAAALDNLSKDDAIAIHEVVQSQLDAFLNDDATGAFALATPEKRTQIGSANNFLRLIREQYNPIYRHLVVIFSRPELVNGNPVQIVRVTASDSRVWIAIFWMQQEADHSWKIDGCQLLETTTVSI